MALLLQSLVLLVSTAVPAATLSLVTDTCGSAELFELSVTSSRNASGQDNVKVQLEQPVGCTWQLDVAARERSVASGSDRSITTIALFSGLGHTRSAEDANGKQRQDQRKALEELRATVEELKTSNADLQQRLNATGGGGGGDKGVATQVQEQQKTIEELRAAVDGLKASNAALRQEVEEVTRATCTTAAATPAAPTQQTLAPKEREALSKRLLSAADRGDLDEMRQLLEQGADVHYRDGENDMALHKVAKRGHCEALRLLVTRGSRLDARNSGINTALNYAASRGYVRCVEVLVAAGASLNTRNKLNHAPLRDAAAHGHEAVVRVLVAAGADTDIRDEGGHRPRDIAASQAIRALLPP